LLPIVRLCIRESSAALRPTEAPMSDVIFQPLHFKNLAVKNRIFRSNISGRFDNYDGSGTQTRINWELKFARGWVQDRLLAL